MNLTIKDKIRILFSKVDFFDLIERAAWTFAEAALATFCFSSDWKAVIGGAIGAGLSAVKTCILAWIRTNKPEG